MNIIFYKESKFNLEFVFDELKRKLNYNLKFENINGFNDMFNEIFKNICNLILAYQNNNIDSLEQFKRLKRIINETIISKIGVD